MNYISIKLSKDELGVVSWSALYFKKKIGAYYILAGLPAGGTPHRGPCWGGCHTQPVRWGLRVGMVITISSGGAEALRDCVKQVTSHTGLSGPPGPAGGPQGGTESRWWHARPATQEKGPGGGRWVLRVEGGVKWPQSSGTLVLIEPRFLCLSLACFLLV